MKGKLNLFQAAILRWRALQPYNAVHVVRVAHPIDPVRLEKALRGQLQDLGLTGLELDARRRATRDGRPGPLALRVIPGAGEAVAACAARSSASSMRASHPKVASTVPLFAIDNGAEFYLGLAYDLLSRAETRSSSCCKAWWIGTSTALSRKRRRGLLRVATGRRTRACSGASSCPARRLCWICLGSPPVAAARFAPVMQRRRTAITRSYSSGSIRPIARDSRPARARGALRRTICCWQSCSRDWRRSRCDGLSPRRATRSQSRRS